MNIKTFKAYGSKYSDDKLLEIQKRLESMVERTHGAIERESAKDWRLGKTTQHQLYREYKKTGFTNKNRLETINNINKLQQMLANKGGTLKGTKEIVKNREAYFIEKAIDDGIDEKRAKEIAKSKDFYDFLHSDTYEKIANSVGKKGSPTIANEYIKKPDSAVKYYEKLVASRESQGKEISYKDLRVPKRFLK